MSKTLRKIKINSITQLKNEASKTLLTESQNLTAQLDKLLNAHKTLCYLYDELSKENNELIDQINAEPRINH